MDIRNELTPEQCMEYFTCMRESGITTDLWYEAIPYKGPSNVVHLALFATQDGSAEVLVAAGNDYEGLDTIGSFVNGIPGFSGWRFWIEMGNWELGNGHFVLVERRTFVGDNREPVVRLLRTFGVNQQLIDHTLNMVEEKSLGYVLSPSHEYAQTLADGLTVGAHSPDDEGTAALVAFFLEYGRKLSSQASTA